MRILHVIAGLSVGGAEANLCSLIERSEGKGFHHIVVSFLANGPLKPRLERAGATVIELSSSRGARGLLALRQLGVNINKCNPDIVHSWMYHANAATAVLQRLDYFRCPLIWSIRQSLEDPTLDRRLTRAITTFGAWVSDRPNAIVYNSLKAATTHEDRGYSAGRRMIIHNGVDCNRFRPRPEARAVLRAQLGLPPESILIGRVARWSPMKDFKTLISAFAAVKRSLPAARLVLVGTGIDAQNDELRALCRDSGSADHVHLMGPRLDVETIYPALDVLVSSSRSNEGFPNVVAEALASGNLVAVTSSGETSLMGGAHEAVATQNSAALSAAITRLVGLPAQEKSLLSNNARSFVLDHFSLHSCVERYHQLYRETASELHSEDYPNISERSTLSVP